MRKCLVIILLQLNSQLKCWLIKTRNPIRKGLLSLCFSNIFEELRNVNTRLVVLFLQCMEKESLVDKVDSEAIREEVTNVVFSVFDAFEFCSSE